VVGGLASASPRRKGNALLINDRVLESGLVGVSLGGEVRVEGLVSQGCRGFGPNLVITRAEGQLIEQLGGRPALEVLHEAIEAMGPADRQLLSKGLFVGRVVNEYKDRFGRDDYLIRNVVGVMKDDRALAVADHVRVGQTIRFHVRDAVTATEDLAMLIDGQTLRERAMGAVLVSCNGRGSKLFAEANHDARALARLFDEREGEPGEKKAKSGQEVAMWGDRPPVAGFFAGGEIGPVGDGVFLHGHTACAAIFRRP
jgi:small ligand-binding sensory domain FIST